MRAPAHLEDLTRAALLAAVAIGLLVLDVGTAAARPVPPAEESATAEVTLPAGDVAAAEALLPKEESTAAEPVAPAEQAAAPLLRFRVKVAAERGTVLCGLFDGPDTWLEEPAVGASAQVEDGLAECVFEGLAPGVYAISAFLDENRDGKLATGLFGIPTEPVCVSNDVRPTMGPPPWDDAAFRFEERPLTLGCDAR